MAVLKDWLSKIEYSVLMGDPASCQVSRVIFDSRKAEPGTVFVAMRGANVDAHSFIPQVTEKGCRALVTESLPGELPFDIHALPADCTVVYTEDARLALAMISAAAFGDPQEKLTVIGITGTKGKTTTAHMVKAIIDQAGKKCGMIGTTGIVYGDTHIATKNTTPESYDIQKTFRDMADAGCTHVVMEVSSQALKLSRVAGITFDCALFTNIEPDHIGPNEHADFEEYKYYKSCIFRQAKLGILNNDADYASELAAGAPCSLLTYGIDHPADIVASGIRHDNTADFVGTVFGITGKDDFEVKLGLPGKYNVSNALAAISACLSVGIDWSLICSALRDIRVNGRMEVAYKCADFSVIVDYAHNAMAMENLLSTLRAYEPKRLVVVFGCGGNRSKDRRYGMGEMAARMADLSILTADNSRFEETEDIIADIRSTLVPAGGKYVEVPDRREAIRYAMKNAEPGDMIAVIGKGHEDYQEIKGVRTHFLDREVIEEIASEIAREKN